MSKWALTGAHVYDGLGGPGEQVTVLVDGDTIIDLVSAGTPVGGDYVDVDLGGLALAPGFIDVHSHADNAPFLAEDDLSKIMQGVTTEVMGNCGFSLAPRVEPYVSTLDEYATRIFPPLDWQWHTFAEMLQAADSHGYVTNYAPMVGHHTARIAAMGMKDEPLGDAACEHMRASLAEAFEAGAVGFSTGLIYPPGVFSTPDELAELVQAIPTDAVYATHMRGEGAQVFTSINEALSVAERSGRRLQISHLKVAGKYNWGRMDEAIELIHAARERGVDVRQDIYPYTAGSTMLTACLPPWFQDGGNPGVLRRLDDPASIERLRVDMEQISMDWENMALGAGWEGIVVSSTGDHRFEGRSIAQIAEEEGLDPLDALVHVLREEQLQATMTVHQMSEADVITALEDPFTMVGSDGLPPGTGGRPHPRMYGTFPRILGRFHRELGVLSAGDAVRRMTSLPASTFGLTDRGVIARGAKADLVAFAPAEVHDTATFEDPVRFPQGVPWVMLNGDVVVEGSAYVGGRHGRRLKRGS